MSAQRKLNAALGVGVSAVTLALMVKLLLGPNAGKMVRMSTAKHAEEFCMTQAQMWAHAADLSKKAYDGARTVTL